MNATIKFIIFSLWLAFAAPAAAVDAGKALFVFGDVSIASNTGSTKSKVVALSKGSRLSVGDTVITGAQGRAQLLLNDQTKIALRPNSRFQIETFAYSSAATDELVSASENQAHFELLKGGFRSITGGVGKANPDGFEVRTAVAVIGIRGTDFAGRLCVADGDCGEETAPGLYLGVNDGGIFGRANGQEYDVYDDQYAFSDGTGFSRLADLPANILDSGLGVTPSQARKSTNRFISVASDPAVFSTPVGREVLAGPRSNAEEPAGHEGSGGSN